MTITLSDPLASRLQQAAARRGQAPGEYALAALADVIEQDMPAAHEGTEEALDPDADLTDAECAEAQAGIERGLTDFAEGRFSSADDFHSKMQAKHGLFTPHV